MNFTSMFRLSDFHQFTLGLKKCPAALANSADFNQTGVKRFIGYNWASN